ncbi:uncharacterized protein LOC144385319 isoform X1 [Gasterosteus aculeatus]
MSVLASGLQQSRGRGGHAERVPAHQSRMQDGRHGNGHRMAAHAKRCHRAAGSASQRHPVSEEGFGVEVGADNRGGGRPLQDVQQTGESPGGLQTTALQWSGTSLSARSQTGDELAKILVEFASQQRMSEDLLRAITGNQRGLSWAQTLLAVRRPRPSNKQCHATVQQLHALIETIMK